MDGLFLSNATLAGLTQRTQREILEHFGVVISAMTQSPVTTGSASPQPAHPPANIPVQDGSGPPDFTVAMVRRLTKGISKKTLAALRVIAKSDTPEFHMKDVIDAIDDAETYMDLRGVWSAITRRSRAILDDFEARLIWWEDEGIYDDDENYLDHIARVSPMTHQSLKAHFAK